MVWYHGTTRESANKILTGGIDIDAPRVRDPGDFGWGFYVTADFERAKACGDVVLVVEFDEGKIAQLPSPYFLDGLQSLKPTTPPEQLFHKIAFKGDELLTVRGAKTERAEISQRIREEFLKAGYTGIHSLQDSEVVVFDPSIIRVWMAGFERDDAGWVKPDPPGKVDGVLLSPCEVPSNLVFTPVDAGGSNVTCIDCGLSREQVWDELGMKANVWKYESDRRGIALWVQATCNGCGRIEVFRETGGDASGYARDPRDYDRKHETNHRLWKEAQ